MNTMAKILIRQIKLSSIYRMQDHANERSNELIEMLKLLAHVKKEKTRRILKSWFKLTHQNNLLGHKLRNYTLTHDSTLLQNILYEWNRTAAMLRCLKATGEEAKKTADSSCLLYTSPSPRDLSTSRMPSSACKKKKKKK
eukprot:TRINITY_DN22366_c0_g1_i2.p1 TRINITY_DN22366_c0_g1~~TRINITY_DN22366_c0_g1_i2.p1  ORF type:complete len:140 (+),score=32.71 TRINITY_DN22366_c0_g1_i2:246-665(+)